MCHFCNNFLNFFSISSLFSGGIIISSTGSCFSILLSLDLAADSTIFFTKNSPALWTTFFEASSPVSIIFYIFLQMKKNPYHLTYFLVLGSTGYCIISVY